MNSKEQRKIDISEGKIDIKLFKENCDGLKDDIDKVGLHKKEKSKHLHNNFCKHIMSLKAINRRTQFRVKNLRDATFHKKLAVDHKTRQLQNLLYELAHLENTVQTCLEFKSLHDEINLIPKDEYLKTTGVDGTEISEHQLTLDRLCWELKERKELHSSLTDMSKTADSITKQINDKEKYLDGLSQKLKDISDFTRPLDVEMSLNVHESEDAFQSALLLPTALYIIYSHISAFVESKGMRKTVSVRIIGDLELARSVNLFGSSKNDDVDAESSEVDDQERTGGKRKKGRHKSKRTNEDLMYARNHDSPHPLAVLMHVESELGSKWPKLQFNLTFSWLLKECIVTVKTQINETEACNGISQTGRDLLTSENLLSGLQFVVCDTAENPGHVFLMHKISSDRPESSFLHQKREGAKQTPWGQPYLWAQQLAGQKCLPCLSDMENVTTTNTSAAEHNRAHPSLFGFIDTWFSAITRRIESRLSLNAELCAIEGGILNLSENQKASFPITDIVLSTWECVTFDELKTWPRAETFIALHLVQPTDSIFKCQMAYKGRDVLTLCLSVPACYPEEPSLIILGNAPDAFPAFDLTAMHIQELETEVNCFWRELPSEEATPVLETDDSVDAQSRAVFKNLVAPSSPSVSQSYADNLLSCQLARLATFLPVIWSSSAATSSLSTSLPHTALKYRTRGRPLKFLPKIGMFNYN